MTVIPEKWNISSPWIHKVQSDILSKLFTFCDFFSLYRVNFTTKSFYLQCKTFEAESQNSE